MPKARAERCIQRDARCTARVREPFAAIASMRRANRAPSGCASRGQRSKCKSALSVSAAPSPSASPGADVRESRRGRARVPARTCASPGADVRESRCGRARVPARTCASPGADVDRRAPWLAVPTIHTVLLRDARLRTERHARRRTVSAHDDSWNALVRAPGSQQVGTRRSATAWKRLISA